MNASEAKTRSLFDLAVLSYGFRPLFLLAGIWSAVAMAAWIAMLTGVLTLPTAFDMISWHVHELLYGFLPAVIGGFLLTAVASWTGRPPVAGALLFVLIASWLVGRAAICFSAQLGVVITAIADLSFLFLLILVIGRELVAARNWRNLKVLALVALLFCGNALFHAEAARGGSAFSGYGARFGIAAAILLISLIGGRIIPAFTRDWLSKRTPGRLPAQFGPFDLAAMIIAGAAVLFWVAAPENAATALLCGFAGALHAVRLGRWAGERTSAEPLVLILHIAYAFVPLGFLTIGSAIAFPDIVPPSAALHAWTAGAIGIMTLAVMTRATLGHAGKPLHAKGGTVFIYACAITAALLRVGSGLGVASAILLELAAAAWITAFASFAFLYGPLLVRSRQLS